MRRPRRRIRRTSRGAFDIRLPANERSMLRTLPGQLRELLGGTEDLSVRRLFPPAYPDDPDLDQEYSAMVRDDLLAGHLRSLEIFESTVDARRVDEEQLVAWLGAINDFRLVLGTRLDVEEDFDVEAVSPEDPMAASYAVYWYLGWLEEEVVDSLASGSQAPPRG